MRNPQQELLLRFDQLRFGRPRMLCAYGNQGLFPSVLDEWGGRRSKVGNCLSRVGDLARMIYKADDPAIWLILPA
jgi:hypothetical protein